MALGFLATTNELSELGTWNLVLRHHKHNCRISCMKYCLSTINYNHGDNAKFWLYVRLDLTYSSPIESVLKRWVIVIATRWSSLYCSQWGLQYLRKGVKMFCSVSFAVLLSRKTRGLSWWERHPEKGVRICSDIGVSLCCQNSVPWILVI
jgi:hypothetical protein